MEAFNNRLGNPQNPGDYKDPETGLLVCGVCGEKKQRVIEIMGLMQIVPCACRCTQEQDAARREQMERQRAAYDAARRRAECFGGDAKKAAFTFDVDDQWDARLSRRVRGYAKEFASYRKTGKGLLLLGPVGTGKTFYACCIANAVIDAGYSARVTNFAQIANELQPLFDKDQVHSRLRRVDLLVLDDLAAERDTSFMQEIVFQVVEERSAAQKPLIVTSNVSAQEFLNPGDLARRRVFSRLAEVCIPLSVSGPDRRLERRKAEQAEDQKRLEQAGD